MNQKEYQQNQFSINQNHENNIIRLKPVQINCQRYMKNLEENEQSMQDSCQRRVPSKDDQGNSQEILISQNFRQTPPQKLKKSQIIKQMENNEEFNQFDISPKKIRSSSQQSQFKDSNINTSHGKFFRLINQKRFIVQFVDNLMRDAYKTKVSKLTKFQRMVIDDMEIYKNDYPGRNSRIKYFFCENINKLIRQVPIFDQSCILIILWDTFQLLTILIIFFYIPFKFSFQIENEQSIFSLEQLCIQNLQLFYVLVPGLDIILSNNIAYIDKGVTINCRNKIIENYFKTNAFSDIFSFLILLLVFFYEHEDKNQQLLVCFIPAIFYYFLKMKKISVIIYRVEEYFKVSGKIQDFIALFKLSYKVILIGHIFSCLWHGVGYYQENSFYTWLHEYDLVNESISVKYNYAFYWSAMTMITVGYGDVVPQNNLERLTANLTMFLACGVFAFSINQIGCILESLNNRDKELKKNIGVINQFLQKNKIQYQLQQRIKSYLTYILKEEQENQDQASQELVSKLSNSLQLELEQEIYIKALRNTKALSQFNEQTLRDISQVMEIAQFSPEEFIYYQDSYDDCALYILQKGEAQIMFHSETQQKVLKQLKDQGQFGEISFFLGTKRNNSVQSIGFTKCFKIKRNDFIEIISKYENQRELFAYIKDEKQEECGLGIKCMICDKSNHIQSQCPVVHFVPNRETLLKRLLYPQYQEQDQYFERKNTQFYRFQTLKARKNLLDFINKFQNQLCEEKIQEDQENIDQNITSSYECENYNESQTQNQFQEEVSEYIESKVIENLQEEVNKKSIEVEQKVNKSMDDKDILSTSKKQQCYYNNQFLTNTQPEQKNINQKELISLINIQTHFQNNKNKLNDKKMVEEISKECFQSKTFQEDTQKTRISNFKQNTFNNLLKNEEQNQFRCIENFDKAQNYTIYFPQFNLDLVILKYIIIIIKSLLRINKFIKHYSKRKRSQNLLSLYTFDYNLMKKMNQQKRKYQNFDSPMTKKGRKSQVTKSMKKLNLLE